MIDKIVNMSLSDYGSWASLVGLVITFITWMSLYNIKRKFLLRATIDEHTEKLNEISGKISAFLQDFSQNSSEINEQFDIAKVELRAMKKYAKGDLLSDIKSARCEIYMYRSQLCFWNKSDEKAARVAKNTLSVVTAQLHHEKTQHNYR